MYMQGGLITHGKDQRDSVFLDLDCLPPEYPTPPLFYLLPERDFSQVKIGE